MADSGIFHEDVGEKIGGARKDFSTRALSLEDLKTMTPEEKSALVLRDNIWGKINLQTLREEGASPQTAAFAKELRLLISPRPNRVGSGFRIEDYVAFVSELRDLVARHPRHDVPVPLVFGEGSGTLAEEFSNFMLEKEMAERTLTIPTGEPILRFLSHGLAETVLKNSSRSRYGRVDVWNAVTELRNVGKILPTPLDWSTLCPDPGSAPEGDDSPKRKKGTPERPFLDHLVTEKSFRNGRDMTGEDLIATFGFRGIEHGNWMTQPERQESINHAYDAFMALAGAFDLNPRDLSLDGTLALGFGSRGRGGRASAHYEPLGQVINLTKTKGAGSLAHEWAHAFDHWMGRSLHRLFGQKMDSTGFATGIPNQFSFSLLKRDAPEGTFSFKGGRFYEKAFTEHFVDDREFLADKAQRVRHESESLMAAWPRLFPDKTPEESAALKDLAQKTLAEIADGIDTFNPDHFSKGWVGEHEKRVREEIGIMINSLFGWTASSKILLTPAISPFTARLNEAISQACYPSYETRTLKIWATVRPNFLEEAFKIENKPVPKRGMMEPLRTGYWATAPELFARSFEAAVEDITHARGTRNDYLVHGTGINYPGARGNPYPSGTERTFIRESLTQIMSDYRTFCEMSRTPESCPEIGDEESDTVSPGM